MREQLKLALAIQRPDNNPDRRNMGQETLEILEAGGLAFRRTSRVDFAPTNVSGLYLWLRKNGDLAEAVARQDAALAIIGQDRLGEYNGPTPPVVLKELGFSFCTLKIAVSTRREFGPKRNRAYRNPNDLVGRVIYTSYPWATHSWLRNQGLSSLGVNGTRIESDSYYDKYVRVVNADGGAESCVNWGSAQACVEISDTGTSMASNETRIIDEVLKSQAVLVANPNLGKIRGSEAIFWRTLRMIMTGLWKTAYTMLEFNYPTGLETEVLDGLPARESPTKTPLGIPGWGAAKVLISKAEVGEWVGKLLERGARDAVLEQVERVYPNLDDPEVTRMMRVIYGQNWELHPPYTI